LKPDAESAEDRFRKGSEDNTHLTPQLTLSNHNDDLKFEAEGEYVLHIDVAERSVTIEPDMR
jgi:hypothetical protein